jgi:flagellar protein FlbD
MICLTRLHGSAIYINPDQIQSIEETPDTHITLMNGNRFIVVEKTAMIVDKIVTLKASILRRAGQTFPHKHCKKRHPAVPILPWSDSPPPETAE